MNAKTLLVAVAGFVIYAPITFIWHTVLFSSLYIGPDHAIKSADSFNPAWIVGAAFVHCLGMAYFVPAVLGRSATVVKGALLGALFASLLVDYHNLQLIGLFPNIDPPSLYVMDALWAVVDGAITGAVMVALHGRLHRQAAVAQATA
jgi:uncharacterized membrane protein YkvI